MNARRPLLLVASLALLSGCKDPQKERDAQRRAEAQASLPVLAKLAAEPQGLPACGAPAAGPVLVTSRHVVLAANGKDDKSALAAAEPEFNDRAGQLPSGHPCKGFDTKARFVGKAGPEGPSLMDLEGVHGCLSKVKTIAVFRAERRTDPKDGPAGFVPGGVEGALTVFDATGKPVCAHPIRVASSGTVRTYGGEGKAGALAARSTARAHPFRPGHARLRCAPPRHCIRATNPLHGRNGARAKPPIRRERGAATRGLVRIRS
jgi:hypothetical protein